MSKIQFSVNEIKCAVDQRLPRETTLNAYLRYVMGLPGTKAMCNEGGCGACIVMVRAMRYPSGKVETFSVNSCLVLVFSCHGWEVTTVEGVGTRLAGYSEVQKRIVGFNATQCGYCTPGWVMQITSLQDKGLTMKELENSVGCNTCRCTGLRPLMDTVKSFGVDATPELCQKVADIEEVSRLCVGRRNCLRKYSEYSHRSDWSVVEDAKGVGTIALNFGKHQFFKVHEITEIFDILSAYGMDSYMLVDGNTGKGIFENFEYPRVLIDISDVKELKGYGVGKSLTLGANVSLEDCIGIFKDTSKKNSEFAYLAQVMEHFELIAHIPVRKIGSIAGNLMCKRAVPKYQSDLFIIFECIGATVTVRKMNGKLRTLSMRKFIGYEMMGVLIVSVQLPALTSSHIFRSYKIMPRNQNAQAIVNAAFLIKLNNSIIHEANFVFGNLQPASVRASMTEAYVVHKNIFKNIYLQGVLRVLCDELKTVPIEGELSTDCRKKLALGIFYKFILSISPTNMVLPKYVSGGQLLKRPVSKSKQDYQTDPSLYPLNQPVPKFEAAIQAGGEAQYVNDIPPLPREVFGAFVLSTVCSGEVDTIDVDAVLAIDGVVSLYTPKDIPGVNSFTYPGIQLETAEEEILATKIKYYGQPIAIVAAKTQELAARVAKYVKVIYRNVSRSTPVLTIDEAKKYSNRHVPGNGSITPTTKGSDTKKIIKGVYEMGAQYDYSMETISCVVRPIDRIIEVYDSTQWMELTQIAVARCLGVNESDVVVRARRTGGLGGKVSRSTQAATACAIVAKNLDVPCRFILPLQTNLNIAGMRMPCQCDYEVKESVYELPLRDRLQVGVDSNGKIQYLNASIIEDCGCSSNESILDLTAQSFPNCYNKDTWSLKTAGVLTDLSSNSLAKAAGACEGIASIEHIMEHIAFSLAKDSIDVRLANMRADDNDLPELIEELKKDANYDTRALEIANFNKINRWMKRAININVMSYPVTYSGNYTAAVTAYRIDGTVTVCIGGAEMGQGLNTKAAQVCAYELGIPLDYVNVISNYSFVGSNNAFTGYAVTTESVCYSIIKACDLLKERLATIKSVKPEATWVDIIKEAGTQQIDLTVVYMMADTDENLKGYNAFAVSIIETQLDVLTGRFQIVRADILEDVGVSVNPGLDVGQVEGAYIQGIGYFTSEKVLYDKETGRLLTNRSQTYNVPLGLDIPVEFNVKLRNNYKNPNGVLGSKTCGEIGICTSHGITHALRQCIMESRKESGYDTTEWIHIPVPYDTEAILKALAVKPEELLLK